MKKRVGAGVARPASGIGRFPLSREWGVRLIFIVRTLFYSRVPFYILPTLFPFLLSPASPHILIPPIFLLPPYFLIPPHLPIPAKAGISLSTGAGRATLALHRFLLLSESQTTQKKILHFFGKKAEFDIQWTQCFAKPALLEENGRGDESHF